MTSFVKPIAPSPVPAIKLMEKTNENKTRTNVKEKRKVPPKRFKKDNSESCNLPKTSIAIHCKDNKQEKNNHEEDETSASTYMCCLCGRSADRTYQYSG